ncbi:response regulator transcription factor, partial [candidate division KSB1 bacterium]
MATAIFIGEDDTLYQKLFSDGSIEEFEVDFVHVEDYFAEMCSGAAGVLNLVIIDGMSPACTQIVKWFHAKHPSILLLVFCYENDALFSDTTVSLLGMGADDVQPVSVDQGELCERIRALIRRDRINGSKSFLDLGRVQIDFCLKSISVDGRPVHMTSCEWMVIEVLARNHGRVVTKENIQYMVYGQRQEDVPMLKIVDVWV